MCMGVGLFMLWLASRICFLAGKKIINTEKGSHIPSIAEVLRRYCGGIAEVLTKHYEEWCVCAGRVYV